MTDPTAADPAEPTGHTIDGTPWEEARPPHLPDPVVHAARRVPLASLAFLAIAVLLAVWTLTRFMAGIDLSISSVVGLAQQTILTVAPALFGAALFARHPDARSADARLVFGVVLLVVVTILGLASGFLGDLFSSAGDELGLGPTPAGVGLRAFRGALTAFALVYVARGLLDARAYEDDGGAPRRTRLLAILAIAGIVAEVLILLDWIRRGEVELSGTLFLADTVAAIVSLALVLGAQAYLVATTWTGASSSERPTAAWRWAAIGWGAIFGAELISILVSVVAALVPPADPAGSVPYMRAFEVGGWIGILGWLAAIAAFVLGLPREAAGAFEADADDPAEPPNAGPLLDGEA